MKYASYHWWVAVAVILFVNLTLLIPVKAQDKVVVIPLNSAKNSNITIVDVGQSIQSAINGLPVTGGTVFIKSGLHTITQGIHINRSNVTITGEQGTIIKLGNEVKQPVLLLGKAIEVPTLADRIENIHIMNLEIDGNKLNQSSEYDSSRSYIRNNGIDIRTVKNLWIQNVNIHDARSGGIVATNLSKNIFIDNVICTNSFFDGIALYDSQHIIVSNFVCDSNDDSGLSLDNNLKWVTFVDGLITNNGKNGIFARNSDELLFSSIIVSSNGEYGAFLGYDINFPTETGVHKILFTGCSFFNNAKHGLMLASPSTYSNNNAVAGCFFVGNTDGCITFDTGSLIEGSNICVP